MICSKCGKEMRQTDKNTFTGRDIREYLCDGCGHSDWEDRGKALWQILSDDREEFEAARANRAFADAPGQHPQTGQGLAISLWNRVRAWLGKGR